MRELQDGLACEDLPRSRQRTQPRRQVERAAPVAVADRNGLPGVEADPDPTRQVSRGEPFLERDCGAQGLTRRVEDD